MRSESLLTFDFDAFVVADISSDLHGITDQCTTAGMLHSSFNQRIILDHIYRESCAPQASKAILDLLDLDGVEGNEGCLSTSVLTKVLLRTVQIR